MSGATSLRKKEPVHGFWCVTGHPAIVDTAASAGPDFIIIDTQHGGHLSLADASLFTVMASYGVPGLVRVEAIEVAPIGRALDLGAAGVIVPLVESADDARRAVAATKYAPHGGRSFGMQTNRVGAFDEAPFVVIQVETAAALDNIDEIASVEGVDALYIGPADLGLSLGGEPASEVSQVFDGTHPNAARLRDAFDAVVDAAISHRIAPGLHCAAGTNSAEAVKAGFTFTSVAVDLTLIGKGVREHLSQARGG